METCRNLVGLNEFNLDRAYNIVNGYIGEKDALEWYEWYAQEVVYGDQKELSGQDAFNLGLRLLHNLHSAAFNKLPPLSGRGICLGFGEKMSYRVISYNNGRHPDFILGPQQELRGGHIVYADYGENEMAGVIYELVNSNNKDLHFSGALRHRLDNGRFWYKCLDFPLMGFREHMINPLTRICYTTSSDLRSAFMETYNLKDIFN